MGRCAKLGRPDCMRLLGYVARGANCCVRSSAQGWCLPYLGCVRLVRVRRAALLDEAVVLVWVTSASERDIRKESIQQAKKRPETVESLAASVGVLWRCPTLPQPIGCSTIGAAGLSFQVRNVAGRFPGAVTTTRLFVQHHPPLLFVWWGCGLIVVCIVVAAVLLRWCFATRTLVGCCLVLAN